jgi:hypothetical protein
LGVSDQVEGAVIGFDWRVVENGTGHAANMRAGRPYGFPKAYVFMYSPRDLAELLQRKYPKISKKGSNSLF